MEPYFPKIDVLRFKVIYEIIFSLPMNFIITFRINGNALTSKQVINQWSVILLVIRIKMYTMVSLNH